MKDLLLTAMAPTALIGLMCIAERVMPRRWIVKAGKALFGVDIGGEPDDSLEVWKRLSRKDVPR